MSDEDFEKRWAAFLAAGGGEISTTAPGLRDQRIPLQRRREMFMELCFAVFPEIREEYERHLHAQPQEGQF